MIAMLMCLGLGACGSKSNLNQDYVGKYKIISMSDGTTEYGQDLLEAASINYYIELKKDGSVAFDVGEGEEEGTWTNEKINLNGDRVSFTYEDGAITLTEDSYSMTFKK